jgi:isoleucyl-tRNA synthetase
VALLAPDDLKGLLKAEAEALREILIVSELQVDPKLEETECAAVFYAAGEIPGLKIVVCKAGGGKCERCWHYSIGVGSDQSMPELCPRCVKALS